VHLGRSLQETTAKNRKKRENDGEKRQVGGRGKLGIPLNREGETWEIGK